MAHLRRFSSVCCSGCSSMSLALLNLREVGGRQLEVFESVHGAHRYPLDTVRARIRRAPIEERHDTADVEPLLAERAHGVPRGRAGRQDVLQKDHPLAEPPPRLLDHVPGAVVLWGL